MNFTRQQVALTSGYIYVYNIYQNFNVK